MAQVGSHVEIHYRGTLEDGTEFDSSYTRNEPLCFVVGAGEVLPVLEEATLEMEPGDACDKVVACADAYGERDDAATEEVPASIFGETKNIPVGGVIAMRGEDGRMAQARVLEANGDVVRLDYNHPLAGHDLHFHVELLKEERLSALEQEKHPPQCSCHKVRKNLEAQRAS